MAIVIFVVIAGCLYWLYRDHTSSLPRADKNEAVRAHLFLESLNEGLSVELANSIADQILIEPDSPRVKHISKTAWTEYKLFHKGNALPIIGHAYRQGMRSTMPDSYRNTALATGETLAIELFYRARRIQRAEEQKATLDSDGYQIFYERFSNEVYRLSAERPDALMFGKGWEQATMLAFYSDGDDPLYVAARYCDEHNCTKEKFSTFETYRAAVINELTRYAADAGLLEEWKLALGDAPLHKAFSISMHPRRAAYGYYRSSMRQTAP